MKTWAISSQPDFREKWLSAAKQNKSWNIEKSIGADQAEFYSDHEVYKFNGNSWILLGKLSEAHSQSWDMNSGKIINGYAYVGEELLAAKFSPFL